jgi:hypothetical protein
VSVTQFEPASESVIADVCLGIAIAGLNALIRMALIIVFVRPPQLAAVAERESHAVPVEEDR